MPPKKRTEEEESEETPILEDTSPGSSRSPRIYGCSHCRAPGTKDRNEPGTGECKFCKGTGKQGERVTRTVFNQSDLYAEELSLL